MKKVFCIAAFCATGLLVAKVLTSMLKEDTF